MCKHYTIPKRSESTKSDVFIMKTQHGSLGGDFYLKRHKSTINSLARMCLRFPLWLSSKSWFHVNTACAYQCPLVKPPNAAMCLCVLLHQWALKEILLARFLLWRCFNRVAFGWRVSCILTRMLEICCLRQLCLHSLDHLSWDVCLRFVQQRLDKASFQDEFQKRALASACKGTSTNALILIRKTHAQGVVINCTLVLCVLGLVSKPPNTRAPMYNLRQLPGWSCQ